MKIIRKSSSIKVTGDEMRKLLYLMSIDWGWIVQRPHLLAKELEHYYDVKVVYSKQCIKRWKEQKALVKPDNCSYGLYFPKQGKIPLLKKISDYTMRKAIGNLKQYDIVMLGDPLLYKFIRGFEGLIVYDCMDNYEALETDEQIKGQKGCCEKELIAEAGITLVSSLKLKEKVDNIYGGDKAILVRNGYNDSGIYPIYKAVRKQRFRLGYIGTVSSWMNFKLLEECLKIFKNIEMHLIGPASGYEKNSRKICVSWNSRALPIIRNYKRI